MFKSVDFDQHDVIGTIVILLLIYCLAMKWISETMFSICLAGTFSFILGSNMSLLSGKTNTQSGVGKTV
jgi:hypothetical protein